MRLIITPAKIQYAPLLINTPEPKEFSVSVFIISNRFFIIREFKKLFRGIFFGFNYCPYNSRNKYNSSI